MAQPPADNVFPIPVPYAVTYTDDWHACRDGCSRQHKGNDLMADEGVPVVAVESGVIIRANDTDQGLGGITLWLKGDSGVAYYYAHNVQNLVAEGQRVARGQMIARVGRTGNARATAPHVHFQINLCGETSSAEPCTVDPYPYLQTWAQAQVGGGADGVGWYEPATGAFGQRNESGSPAVGVPVRHARAPTRCRWRATGTATAATRSACTRAPTPRSHLRDDEGVALPPLPFGQPGRPDVWPIAGDFDGDGRDTVGLYRQAEAAFVVLVDVGVESAPVPLGTPGRTDALPVVGDWDGDGRDCVGVYQQGDGAVRPPRRRGRRPAGGDRSAAPAAEVFPVAGDWDGDGREDLGVLRRDAATFELPVPNLLDPDAMRSVPIEGGPAVLPIAGDWNGRDLVTLDELRHIFGAVADDPKVVEGLPALNAAMLRAGISTPARKAAFLATLRSESGFRYDAVEVGNDQPLPGAGLHPDHRRGQLPVRRRVPRARPARQPRPRHQRPGQPRHRRLVLDGRPQHQRGGRRPRHGRGQHRHRLRPQPAARHGALRRLPRRPALLLGRPGAPGRELRAHAGVADPGVLVDPPAGLHAGPHHAVGHRGAAARVDPGRLGADHPAVDGPRRPDGAADDRRPGPAPSAPPTSTTGPPPTTAPPTSGPPPTSTNRHAADTVALDRAPRRRPTTPADLARRHGPAVEPRPSPPTTETTTTTATTTTTPLSSPTARRRRR